MNLRYLTFCIQMALTRPDSQVMSPGAFRFFVSR
jgi:hypothetical protein